MRTFRRLMFHPVRPHTRAGRFVISLVFAAFAALLLVLWAPAHADDSQAPAAESPTSSSTAPSPASTGCRSRRRASTCASQTLRARRSPMPRAGTGPRCSAARRARGQPPPRRENCETHPDVDLALGHRRRRVAVRFQRRIARWRAAPVAARPRRMGAAAALGALAGRGERPGRAAPGHPPGDAAAARRPHAGHTARATHPVRRLGPGPLARRLRTLHLADRRAGPRAAALRPGRVHLETRRADGPARRVHAEPHRGQPGPGGARPVAAAQRRAAGRGDAEPARHPADVCLRPVRRPPARTAARPASKGACRSI